MFKKSMLIIGLVSLTAIAQAETTVPNTFTAGSNIVAAQMNANFSTLASGVNENSTQIDELLARIEALESSMSSSVAGRSYHLSQIGILNRGKTFPNMELHYSSMTAGNLNQNYTLTLLADNTFILTGTENEGEVVNTGKVTVRNDNTPVSASGSYIQNGSELTLNFNDSEDNGILTVSKDGRSLLESKFNGRTPDGNGWYRTESSFVVGIEIER
ncbi:hypothetical protein Q4Q54_00280 [Shewanella sp. SP2S2-4]|uniref:hypothetical protein n=1 Tax=Shewanella sp. SP2S2-4 TaxID=3063539 RepID=UPI00288DFC92|nr:hypothetical protein [Shewanella sp. SP2S2-4]MDT3271921.1 hypothetical protein [Shewanella sp. SP2S2-4]